MLRRALTIGLLLVSSVALGKAAPSDNEDVTKYKDQLAVYTDGKGHYVAMIPLSIGDGEDTGKMFYGDGKTFYAQRRIGGGRQGDEQFDTVFWEPRIGPGYKRSFGLKDGKFTMQCDERITELKPLDKGATEKMVKSATFLSTRWKRQAYALARDNDGVYYYVDKLREEGSKDFRVFRGQKGSLKPLKMINIVSDSEGDVFITHSGRLKLVLDKHETSWTVDGGKPQTLILLPVEDNAAMIYSTLGAYTGEPLGTPCDDL
jgi:hypothetical protein